MATPTELQKAHIIKIVADKIYVAHPDLSGALKTHLTASIAAAGVTATVADNDGWADNDWFVLGYLGDAKTESCDINDAGISRGTSLTITNTLGFAHDIDTPMTRVNERQIRIYGGDTSGAVTNSVVAAHPIQWDKEFTVYQVDTGATGYAYYQAQFFDGASSYGEKSDETPASADLGATSVEKIIQNALRLVNEKVDSDPEGLLSRENLLAELNNWQDDVASRRDWSFELTNDETITATQGETDYALSSLGTTIKNADSEKSIVSVTLGRHTLDHIDWHDMQDEMEGWIFTTVSTAITAADTSCVLTNTNEFSETGAISVGSDTAVDYTGNTESTGTLTGIGATEFAASHAVGIKVFQGVGQNRPTRWTIYNNRFYTNSPCNSLYDSVVFRVRYYQELTRLTDFADTTIIPFAHIAQYFLAGRIEYVKGNHDRGDKWTSLYENKVALEVNKDRQPNMKRIVPIGDDTVNRGPRYKSTESSRYN